MGVFSSHPSFRPRRERRGGLAIANTRVKYFESIEDRKTFEILRETVGRIILSSPGRKPNTARFPKREGDLYQIREKDRVNIRELRKQTEGRYFFP
ncbi:hypothetical protein BANRA_05524 [Klebsiella pneumoniae]|uniref:hypothetical protein n=1 Tax=Klebsiella pneumoniae TaxID=573 RepID=UPI000F277BC7|nr:hypothetical protein [Klebsiella pneumoniae]VCX09570.1 hypothetical protein BANRA_05524 [Klebsiella pneumoniae]